MTKKSYGTQVCALALGTVKRTSRWEQQKIMNSFVATVLGTATIENKLGTATGNIFFSKIFKGGPLLQNFQKLILQALNVE